MLCSARGCTEVSALHRLPCRPAPPPPPAGDSADDGPSTSGGITPELRESLAAVLQQHLQSGQLRPLVNRIPSPQDLLELAHRCGCRSPRAHCRSRHGPPPQQAPPRCMGPLPVQTWPATTAGPTPLGVGVGGGDAPGDWLAAPAMRGRVYKPSSRQRWLEMHLGGGAGDAPGDWLAAPTTRRRVYKPSSRQLYGEADCQGLRIYHDALVDGGCGGGRPPAVGGGSPRS